MQQIFLQRLIRLPEGIANGKVKTKGILIRYSSGSFLPEASHRAVRKDGFKQKATVNRIPSRSRLWVLSSLRCKAPGDAAQQAALRCCPASAARWCLHTLVLPAIRLLQAHWPQSNLSTECNCKAQPLVAPKDPVRRQRTDFLFNIF